MVATHRTKTMLGTLSLTIAGLLGVLIPGSAAAATPAAQPAKTAKGMPCSAGAKACLDLSSHQAWLTDGAGHVTYGPVSARGGSKHAATPIGTFHVIWKDVDHKSKQFHNAPMPYSVFFYPGDAFHGGNTGVASNGCVHLSSSSARHFFNSLQPGDQVQVVK